MTTSRKTAAVVALLSLFCSSKCFGYDDEITHRALTQVAAAKENSKLARFLMEELLLEDGLDHRLPSENGVENPPTVTNWLRYGAKMEDAESRCRANNHFHNPLNLSSKEPWNKAGLVDGPWLNPFIKGKCAYSNYPTQNATSAVAWATNYIEPSPGGSKLISQNNSWNWDSARSYYTKALIAPAELERNESYAKMFRSLGEVLHLLQDMAVPSHVRSDFKSHFETNFSRPDWQWHYEPYELQAARYNSTLMMTYGSPDKIIRPAFEDGISLTKFWDTNRYDSTCRNGTRKSGRDLGLAEYTNANFVSAYTIFTPLLNYEWVVLPSQWTSGRGEGWLQSGCSRRRSELRRRGSSRKSALM